MRSGKAIRSQSGAHLLIQWQIPLSVEAKYVVRRTTRPTLRSDSPRDQSRRSHCHSGRPRSLRPRIQPLLRSIAFVGHASRSSLEDDQLQSSHVSVARLVSTCVACKPSNGNIDRFTGRRPPTEGFASRSEIRSQRGCDRQCVSLDRASRRNDNFYVSYSANQASAKKAAASKTQINEAFDGCNVSTMGGTCQRVKPPRFSQVQLGAIPWKDCQQFCHAAPIGHSSKNQSTTDER